LFYKAMIVSWLFLWVVFFKNMTNNDTIKVSLKITR